MLSSDNSATSPLPMRSIEPKKIVLTFEMWEQYIKFYYNNISPFYRRKIFMLCFFHAFMVQSRCHTIDINCGATVSDFFLHFTRILLPVAFKFMRIFSLPDYEINFLLKKSRFMRFIIALGFCCEFIIKGYCWRVQ